MFVSLPYAKDYLQWNNVVNFFYTVRETDDAIVKKKPN